MRCCSLILPLLFLCPNANPQAAAEWQFVWRIAEAVGAGIAANYATEHLKSYLATRGAAGTPEGNYAEGLKQWNSGNKEEAIKFLKWSADSGYSRAQLF